MAKTRTYIGLTILTAPVVGLVWVVISTGIGWAQTMDAIKPISLTQQQAKDFIFSTQTKHNIVIETIDQNGMPFVRYIDHDFNVICYGLNGAISCVHL